MPLKDSNWISVAAFVLLLAETDFFGFELPHDTRSWTTSILARSGEGARLGRQRPESRRHVLLPDIGARWLRSFDRSLGNQRVDAQTRSGARALAWVHIAIDYVTSADKLAGRAQSIQDARDKRLKAARELRRQKRQQNIAI